MRPERYRSYLIILARRTLRDYRRLQHKIDASDIVQDVLLKAHTALPQFKGNTEQEFTAWLHKILAGKLADAARHFGRQKREAALEQSFLETLDDSSLRLERLAPVDQTSPSQYVWRNERAVILADALAELPDDQRTAIELHYVTGCSVADVAAQMNRTKASVAGLLRRGLAEVRARLE
jgi:RNA polymerase sigma-70 factor (ECF subfamily)